MRAYKLDHRERLNMTLGHLEIRVIWILALPILPPPPPMRPWQRYIRKVVTWDLITFNSLVSWQWHKRKRKKIFSNTSEGRQGLLKNCFFGSATVKYSLIQIRTLRMCSTVKKCSKMAHICESCWAETSVLCILWLPPTCVICNLKVKQLGKGIRKVNFKPNPSWVDIGQRWAPTLANRSNARHRSNIRALPSRCMYPKCGICGQKGQEAIHS
jgi:hypothetical protein